MDHKNGGDSLAPPRPPKSSHIYSSRVAELPIMNTPLTPVVQREEKQFQIQQRQDISTNSSLHNSCAYNIRNNNSSIRSTSSSNKNVNVNSNIGTQRNNINIPTKSANINNSSNLINNNAVQSTPLKTSLILQQSQQYQQYLNISNSISSTTITSINSFTRRRPLPAINIPLLSSISSNIIYSTELPISSVTLAAPRPESQRLANEYVDTPFRAEQLHNALRHQHPAGQTTPDQTTTDHNLLHLQNQGQYQQIHPSVHNLPHNNRVFSASSSSTLFYSSCSHKKSNNTTSTTSATTLLLSEQTQTSRSSVLPITQVITKQPTFLSKDTRGLIFDNHEHHIGSVGSVHDSLNSITCPQCKKCRCGQCQSPKQLPSKWVCNKTCLCSAETVIDYASCLCCVKALFYHCTKDHEMECDDGDNISCVDNPCSCLPRKRAARWGWLCALSLTLPCLWCYWPMQGCALICAKCYASYSRRGCRCQSVGSTTMLPISPISSTIDKKPVGDNGGITHSFINENDDIHRENISNTDCGKTVIQTCDFTFEKKLLDSNSE